MGINESLWCRQGHLGARGGKSHVPYLECKLTTLLKGALGREPHDGRGVLPPGRQPGRGDAQALRFGERCALVSNVQQTVAASSASEALKAIDATLKQCEASLEGSEAQEASAPGRPTGPHPPLSQRRRAVAGVARAAEMNRSSSSSNGRRRRRRLLRRPWSELSCSFLNIKGESGIKMTKEMLMLSARKKKSSTDEDGDEMIER